MFILSGKEIIIKIKLKMLFIQIIGFSEAPFTRKPVSKANLKSDENYFSAYM